MNLTHKAFLTLAALMPFITGISRGMDIAVEDINPDLGHRGQFATLVMRGEIVPGDYDALLRYVTSNNVDLRAMLITLATPGGDITEALKIGQLFKGIYARVAVGPFTGPCASACFIMFISAADRSSLPGLLGIHRPYLSKERFQTLSPSEAERMQTAAFMEAESYLRKLRIPSSLIDVMFENASSEIHWLNDDELKAIGENPAWYEEFLIARCGLDKDDKEKYLEDPHNLALFRKLLDVGRCGHMLTDQEATKNLQAATGLYYKRHPEEEERNKKNNSSHETTYLVLNQQIPNWQQINTSEDFLRWLDDGNRLGTNDVSTASVLRRAFDENRRAIVVAIFKEYLAQHH